MNDDEDRALPAELAKLQQEHRDLDAAICVTFPGTVASLRQMWGRVC